MLKKIFFTLIIKPFLLIVMGLNIKNNNKLPIKGPAIIIANHNSHLDTLSLLSLFPLSTLTKVRPVAARDYFFTNKYTSWISKNLLGILPIDRKVKGKDPLKVVYEALDNEEIVIIFPEGSRGTPEELSSFKNGIHHIVKNKPLVPIIPIYMNGMGKALPKNESLFVPFVGYINIGDEIFFKEEERTVFMKNLENKVRELEINCKSN